MAISVRSYKEIKKKRLTVGMQNILKLIEHRRNAGYGRMKPFHCIFNPDGDDPIFTELTG
jgi:hypothetical protein